MTDDTVKPVAWQCEKCRSTSDVRGVTVEDNWCDSCAACGSMRPLYSQAAIDAAVAAERERLMFVLRTLVREAVIARDQRKEFAYKVHADGTYSFQKGSMLAPPHGFYHIGL